MITINIIHINNLSNEKNMNRVGGTNNKNNHVIHWNQLIQQKSTVATVGFLFCENINITLCCTADIHNADDKEMNTVYPISLTCYPTYSAADFTPINFPQNLYTDLRIFLDGITDPKDMKYNSLMMVKLGQQNKLMRKTVIIIKLYD